MKERPEDPLAEFSNCRTKAEALLREIKRRGGMTSTEISFAMFEHNRMLDGLDPIGYAAAENGQGYWTDVLYGHGGLLKRFCEKGKDRKWRIVKAICHPFLADAPEERASKKRYCRCKECRHAYWNGVPQPHKTLLPVPPGAFGVLWDARKRQLVVGWHPVRESYPEERQ